MSKKERIKSIKEDLGKDQLATVGCLVMEDIVNGNTANQDLLEEMNKKV